MLPCVTLGFFSVQALSHAVPWKKDFFKGLSNDESTEEKVITGILRERRDKKDLFVCLTELFACRLIFYYIQSNYHRTREVSN